MKNIFIILILCVSPLQADEPKQKFDRSPQNLGAVLVFGGTGWYRHPEVAAISGWLARQSKELKMQVDVSENPQDLLTILPKYKVLVLNNNTELPAILNAASVGRARLVSQGGIVSRRLCSRQSGNGL